MRRTLLAVLLGLASLLLQPMSVLAELPDPDRNTTNIGPVTAGPTISQGTASYDSGGIGANTSSTTTNPGASIPGAPGSGYIYRPIPNNATVITGPPRLTSSGVIAINPGIPGSACPAGQTGYYVYDSSGNSVGAICVPDQSGGQPATTPERKLADEASSKQPWPNLVLGVNPGTGLTGLASWFWLGGGSPTMPEATASSGPLTVAVRASFVGVTWDFGDGNRSDSGTQLGKPYPSRSDVQHVYQTDTFGRPGGYPVTAWLRYKVSYSVNGGPWTDFGLKAKGYTRPYVVNQLQPEAVSTQ